MKYAVAAFLSFSVQFSFSQLTAIEHRESSHVFMEEIKCYPNPSAGYVVLEFPKLQNDSELEVINAKGELIDLKPLNAGSMKFVLAELEAGTYTLQIQGVNIQWREKLIVIDK